MSMSDNDKLRADFHTHTAFSDGLGTMDELVEAAMSERLDAIAVTDHDVLDGARWAYGWGRHQERLERTGEAPSIIVIPGVEISSFVIRDGKPDVVHIVLLGVDPFDTGLTSLCESLRVRRIEELRRRLGHAASLGYALGPEAEGRIIAHAFWGKQEIARELVLSECFETVDAAYHALWDGYDTTANIDAYVPAKCAIEAGHSAGGLAVLAHPLRDEARRCLVTMSVAEERVALTQGMGLDGVECFYSAFPESDCLALEAIARARGLVVSCGSDHHDLGRRYRLGRTCGEGANHGHRTNVLEALGIEIAPARTSSRPWEATKPAPAG
ncbi:MAG: PHP domain-containing protein [Coriobacteriales bacterium]|nr:PHP domain-containing protein [Coriobacteriales bacterium]